MNNRHSKKAILKLTLITTSILLMHCNQIQAEEKAANAQEQAMPAVSETVVKGTVSVEDLDLTADLDGKTEDELLEELSKDLDLSTLGLGLEDEGLTKPDAAESTLDSPKNQADNLDTLALTLDGSESTPIAYEEEGVPGSKSLLTVVDPSKVTGLQAATQKGAGTLVAIIDTGFDVNHEIFRIDHQTDGKRLLRTKEDFEKLKAEQNIAYGKWINDKIVFAHNYDKNTEIIGNAAAAMADVYGPEARNILHGTHVAGILAGNGKRPAANGFLMEGLAANAQLMLLRIPERIAAERMSDKFSESYAQAITDAVNLGAQTINMSLGRAADSLNILNDKVKAALQLAAEKGVALVVAAGNEGAFGMDYRKPRALHPDYGTVNSPAISENTLSVASYEAAATLSEVVVATVNGETLKIPITTSKPFNKGKTYDLVYAHYGTEQDFDATAFQGKLALIERGGGLDFATKIRNAQKAGVAGVVIFNDQVKEGNFLIPYRELPVGVMSNSAGNRLKSGGPTLTFNHDFEVVESVGGNRMLPQSSWGVTPEGNIKPDITASGYEIYSSAYNNDYQTLSGTSMSAPHVAGIMAMLKSHLAEKYKDMNLTPKQLLEMTKNILMSSATALYSQDSQAYYSPRQQGAGVVDAEKAMAAHYYVTGTDRKAKINLKQVGDQFEVMVTIHNLGKENKDLFYQVNVVTDQVENGAFTLKPQALLDTPWQKVSLSGKETQLKFTIDTSQFTQKLTEQMAKGYFLEGFVRFKETETSATELMSIPFVGFKGDFANLDALEESIYNNLSKGTFYYTPNPSDHKDQLEYNENAPFETNNYTALLTQSASWGYVDYVNNDGELELAPESPKRIILGTFERDVNEQMIHVLEVDANHQPYFAISPNQDGNRDEIIPQATFLRNVKDISAQVIDKDGNIIWESESVPSYRKNFSNDSTRNAGHTPMELLQWSGLDKAEKIVADGMYTYRLLYTPVAEGAIQQKTDFLVQVSTQAPMLPLSAHFEDNDRTVTLDLSKEVTQTPVYRVQLVLTYVSNDEELGEQTLYHYFPVDKDGKVQLPEIIQSDGEEIAVALEQLTVVVEDKAGNFATVKLSDLLNKAKATDPDKNTDTLPQEPNQEKPKAPSEQPQQGNDLPKVSAPDVNPNPAKPSLEEVGAESKASKLDTKPVQVTELTETATLQQVLPNTADKKSQGIIAGMLALLTSGFLFKRSKKKYDDQ
ncbi:S8 family serine peptidase [Streptococcus halichoeri]|uniref:S8 family serine peptidase n=1 Tax=Streptococcus halichoeri TaxID=254785 RepID=UPI001359B552|nr:S8 family serine peptidase [Streptococcus halichoeri]